MIRVDDIYNYIRFELWIDHHLGILI